MHTEVFGLNAFSPAQVAQRVSETGVAKAVIVFADPALYRIIYLRPRT